MNEKAIIKTTKSYFTTALIGGLILLAAGLCLQFGLIKNTLNAKGIVGTSFLPLSIAVIYFFKLRNYIKFPQTARKEYIHKTDERLVRLDKDADAVTFRLVRILILVLYLGYNFLKPEGIFEDLGWWMIVVLLLSTLLLKPTIYQISQKNMKEND